MDDDELVEIGAAAAIAARRAGQPMAQALQAGYDTARAALLFEAIENAMDRAGVCKGPAIEE